MGHERSLPDADDLFDPPESSCQRRDSQALVFASLAEELAEQLASVQEPTAIELATRGRELAGRFRDASLGSSASDGSSSLVGDLIAFNRSALDLLSGR